MNAFPFRARPPTAPIFIWLIVLAGVASAALPGGRLVVAQRSEPRTVNPVFAIDEPSRAVTGLMGAPLIRINAETHATEGVLAESWKVPAEGFEVLRRYPADCGRRPVHV